MAIVYPLSMPQVAGPGGANILPSGISLIANNIVAKSQSPYTGQKQGYIHQGSWWSAKVSLPAMTRAQAEPWIAFLLSLRGRGGSFLMGDPAATALLGNAGGSPVTAGVNNAGATILNIKGLTGTLKAGDYFQIGTGTAQRLLKNLTDQSIATVNTTIAASIATGSQTVTPAAMTNIVIGSVLAIDTGANMEVVTVTATTGSTFTAVFALPHTGPGIAVVGAAALDIFPSLHEQIANATSVVLSNPLGVFELDSNTPQYDIDSAKLYSLSFGAIESF